MAADPAVLIGESPTVAEAIERAVTALRAAGLDDARVDAEWLLAETLGLARGGLRLHAARAVPPDAIDRFVRALGRRLAREPLQHILGREGFRGVTVRVTSSALVPRPETELLAGWALELLPATPRPLAIDVGTGTGCIACAMATEREDLSVVALDIAPEAVALARDNVAELGLGARVGVHVSDLFAELAGVPADVVVSNPPYLPSGLIPSLMPEVSRHDPRLALDGGADGLRVIRRLIGEAPRWLVAGGWLVLETAGGEQIAEVAGRMRAGGFVTVQTRPDLAGITRFVAGRMPSCQHGC